MAPGGSRKKIRKVRRKAKPPREVKLTISIEDSFNEFLFEPSIRLLSTHNQPDTILDWFGIDVLMIPSVNQSDDDPRSLNYLRSWSLYVLTRCARL